MPKKRMPRDRFQESITSNRSGNSRGDEIYRRLLDAIQSGALSPGTPLRELKLAETLGTSRTPVREALARLEGDSLVVRHPSRGTMIAELDHTMVEELYVMREVLEGTAAALAARRASDGEIVALRQIADRDRQADRDPERLAKNNKLFHQALYRSAHNRYLLKSLSVLRDAMALLGQTTLSLTGRSDTAIEEHVALVTAIERHDPVAAEAEARAHIRAAYRSRLHLMLLADEARSTTRSSSISENV
jgi:DNA-binding GntR family transcriptional regulator